MYRATNDERVIATWYKCDENEPEKFVKEGKSFMCKIVDKYSDVVKRPIRNVISDDYKMVLYATNCTYEISPGDLIIVKEIGDYKVDQFQIDFADPRFRNFGAHPGAMKLRCPKIISLI